MTLKKLALICLVIIPSCCLAQFQMINKNSLVIINNSGSAISYELKRSVDAAWQTYGIEGGTKVTYKLKSGENLNIKLCTMIDGRRKCVAYLLERTKRYQVYWNTVKKRWDVTEIEDE